MIAWKYDFDECRFQLNSHTFMPIEMTAMTAHGGIIVHRADDGALTIIKDGKVLPWTNKKTMLDCQGRTFKQSDFLRSQDEVLAL